MMWLGALWAAARARLAGQAVGTLTAVCTFFGAFVG
jgi:hypothetical protein